MKAIEVMTIAANDVNEFKRRKELGVNILFTLDSSISSKLFLLEVQLRSSLVGKPTHGLVNFPIFFQCKNIRK